MQRSISTLMPDTIAVFISSNRPLALGVVLELLFSDSSLWHICGPFVFKDVSVCSYFWLRRVWNGDKIRLPRFFRRSCAAMITSCRYGILSDRMPLNRMTLCSRECLRADILLLGKISWAAWNRWSFMTSPLLIEAWCHWWCVESDYLFWLRYEAEPILRSRRRW